MNFNTVKWQDDIVENLKHLIMSKTTGHALLFCGERNTALNLAHAVADGVLCDNHTGGQSCGICPSCVKTKAMSHPDKIVVSATKASIGVDEIRDFNNKVYITPVISDYKVFVFEDAYKLTIQAQNALLKVVEGPPEYSLIIMVCDKEEDLLPTLLSRFKKYNLKIPSGAEVGSYLALKYPEKKELAHFCGSFCEGSVTGAEQLLLADGDYNLRRRLYLFFDRVLSNEKAGIFDFSDYLTDNKDVFEKNVSYFQAILRDLTFIKKGLSHKIINSDLKDELVSLSKKLSSDALLDITGNLSDSYEAITNKNAAFKLTITDFLLKLREAVYDRNSRNKI